ncbi:MAG: hypothetical protein M1833_002222 [Piccolia ochrophora]|nr:MAG: hypothetical protein M1833_002222 [Piccolia ochrophora]
MDQPPKRRGRPPKHLLQQQDINTQPPAAFLHSAAPNSIQGSTPNGNVQRAPSLEKRPPRKTALEASQTIKNFAINSRKRSRDDTQEDQIVVAQPGVSNISPPPAAQTSHDLSTSVQKGQTHLVFTISGLRSEHFPSLMKRATSELEGEDPQAKPPRKWSQKQRDAYNRRKAKTAAAVPSTTVNQNTNPPPVKKTKIESSGKAIQTSALAPQPIKPTDTSETGSSRPASRVFAPSSIEAPKPHQEITSDEPLGRVGSLSGPLEGGTPTSAADGISSFPTPLETIGDGPRATDTALNVSIDQFATIDVISSHEERDLPSQEKGEDQLDQKRADLSVTNLQRLNELVGAGINDNGTGEPGLDISFPLSNLLGFPDENSGEVAKGYDTRIDGDVPDPVISPSQDLNPTGIEENGQRDDLDTSAKSQAAGELGLRTNLELYAEDPTVSRELERRPSSTISNLTSKQPSERSDAAPFNFDDLEPYEDDPESESDKNADRITTMITHQKMRKITPPEKFLSSLKKPSQMTNDELYHVGEVINKAMAAWQGEWIALDRITAKPRGEWAKDPRKRPTDVEFEDQREADIYGYKWDPKVDKRGEQDIVGQRIQNFGGRELRQRKPTTKALAGESEDTGAQETERRAPRRRAMGLDIPDVSESAESAQELKRGGRLRKAARRDQVIESTEAADTPRKRGRPRTNPVPSRLRELQEGSLRTSTESDSTSAPPAKRRGRPPKNLSALNDQETGGSQLSHQRKRKADSLEDDEHDEEEGGPPKRIKSAKRSAAMKRWWADRKIEDAAIAAAAAAAAPGDSQGEATRGPFGSSEASATHGTAVPTLNPPLTGTEGTTPVPQVRGKGKGGRPRGSGKGGRGAKGGIGVVGLDGSADIAPSGRGRRGGRGSRGGRNPRGSRGARGARGVRGVRGARGGQRGRVARSGRGGWGAPIYPGAVAFGTYEAGSTPIAGTAAGGEGQQAAGNLSQEWGIQTSTGRHMEGEMGVPIRDTNAYKSRGLGEDYEDEDEAEADDWYGDWGVKMEDEDDLYEDS